MFVHIFPEGRVIYDRSKVPFKWGVGRLIVESKKPLVVIPFWHVGMEDILPQGSIFPRLWRQITIVIGEPLNFDPFIEEFQREIVSKRSLDSKRPQDRLRAWIVKVLEWEMFQLKERAELLHKSHQESF
eukprot:Sdes_comp18132_c0_seq4m7601